MQELWLVYIGTIGSLLKAYIESHYNVNVCEHLPALEYEHPIRKVAVILIINPEFDKDVFEALREQVQSTPIVWFCQNPQNHTKPDPSVIKYMCSDADEWEQFNRVLEKYLVSAQ